MKIHLNEAQFKTEKNLLKGISKLSRVYDLFKKNSGTHKKSILAKTHISHYI